jgi:transposase
MNHDLRPADADDIFSLKRQSFRSGHLFHGDKVFVDYSGKRIAIVDPGTGVVHDAEIFVGVLGASSYS